MKKIDERILEEISKYNRINKYILEQEAELPPPPADDGAVPPPDPSMAPPADPSMAPPADPSMGGSPVDLSTDPDVEKIGDEKESTKELDITDLVKSQKNVEEKQEEYFDNLFKHLTDLESKLGEMDSIMGKLNDLESKVEKMRPKTAQEKLELRSLDSGPFNQKLSDFFEDKEEEMEKTGKNEYVLTQGDIEDFSQSDIKDSFRKYDTEDDINFKEVK